MLPGVATIVFAAVVVGLFVLGWDEEARVSKALLIALRRDPNLGRLRLAFFVAEMVYSFAEAGLRVMSPVWITFVLATVAVPRAVAVRRATSSRFLDDSSAVPLVDSVVST